MKVWEYPALAPGSRVALLAPLSFSSAATAQLQRLLSDLAHPALDRHAVQRLQRQIDEELHSVPYLPQGLPESFALHLVRAFHSGWIGKAPVRRDRLPWPQRTHLAGCLVAHRHDEIHLGRPGLCK